MTEIIKLSRRAALGLLGAGAIMAMTNAPANSATPAMIRRLIPKGGEPLPVIGLGTYIVFDVAPNAPETKELAEVLKIFVAGGGSLVDSSPMYGRAESAVGELEKMKLTAASLQAECDLERRRARWLVDWKTKLIRDINGTGYGGVVTDVHGVRYDGPVRRATTDKFELKTRYGSVMTGWLNLSPEMLLKMSTAFIRPAVADIPERQWLSAIFAAQTGQTTAANELATKAAAANPDFRGLLPRFFPAAKK